MSPENKAEAHLVQQAARCIADLAIAHNVSAFQVVEWLFSDRSPLRPDAPLKPRPFFQLEGGTDGAG